MSCEGEIKALDDDDDGGHRAAIQQYDDGRIACDAPALPRRSLRAVATTPASDDHDTCQTNHIDTV